MKRITKVIAAVITNLRKSIAKVFNRLAISFNRYSKDESRMMNRRTGEIVYGRTSAICESICDLVGFGVNSFAHWEYKLARR